MGYMRHLPFFSRYHGAPTDYVLSMNTGQIVKQGMGRTFFFRRAVSALAEVPTIDHAHRSLFHAVFVDRHDVAIQAAITYRSTDPTQVARHFDFNLSPRSE